MAGCGLAISMIFSSGAVLAACGHDVHGAGAIEITQLGKNCNFMHYFSPATIIMDDASDPAIALTENAGARRS